jgi:DNA-binding CsgD family transcriptional regulator
VFPFTKREEEDTILSRRAKRLIGKIARGMSEVEAADALKIDEEALRQLRRNPHFRDEVKRAREEGYKPPRVVRLADALDPNEPPPPGASEDAIERQGWSKL